MKYATQRDLGMISKAKKYCKNSPRSSEKAKEITLHLPWGKCKLINFRKTVL